jgi:hypothetical protein
MLTVLPLCGGARSFRPTGSNLKATPGLLATWEQAEHFAGYVKSMCNFSANTATFQCGLLIDLPARAEHESAKLLLKTNLLGTELTFCGLCFLYGL